MYKNNDFIYEAAAKFETITGYLAEIDSSRKEYDALLNINDIQFQVEGKSQIRNSNKSLVIDQILEKTETSKRPVIIIAKYISKDAADEMREKKINYIDGAGNTHIKKGDFFVFITGQKNDINPNTNKSRAFQEAGIKVLFNILSKPENLQLSYRELSAITGISIGSVSNVMKELEDLNFVVKTSTKRILKNKKELLERWLIAYADTLKPRLFKKKMRLKDKDWRSINLNTEQDLVLWGAEPAAAKKVDGFNPEEFLIYTNSNWQELIPILNLVPDEDGEVTINQLFWDHDTSEDEVAPSLLIYADLVTSNKEKNIEIAKRILSNDFPDFFKNE